ncbi:hypothetical protein CFP56_037565 [Quercus suber]|uniref:Uncharacterized protein n=1 Tax=Quercus suber TaxID=58331 RepID=A0AAW0J4J1_QUESU
MPCNLLTHRLIIGSGQLQTQVRSRPLQQWYQATSLSGLESTSSFLCTREFGVVGTGEAHCLEACGRGGRTEVQVGVQEGKILGNKSVILDCIVQELQLH